MSYDKRKFLDSMVYLLEGFIKTPKEILIITTIDNSFFSILSSEENETIYVSKNGSIINVKSIASYLPKKIEIIKDAGDLKIEDLPYKKQGILIEEKIEEEIDETEPEIPELIGKTEISTTVLICNPLHTLDKSTIFFLYKNSPSKDSDTETDLFRIAIFTSSKGYFLFSKNNIRRTSKYFKEKVIGIKVYDPVTYTCVFLYRKDNELYGEIIEENSSQIDKYDSSIDEFNSIYEFNNERENS